MEIINGKEIHPIFNFYNIIIKTKKDVDAKFVTELEELTKKVKKNKKGIWLRIPENIYQKIDIELLQLLQKEFTFYYNDSIEKNLIFLATKLSSYPPMPNANIGSHLIIMTSDNQILVTVEDDGKGNDKISLPGGHIDSSDNGIKNALLREFGEEVTKEVKINHDKLQLATIRLVPSFQRLSNMFSNQDVWFLYKLELSLLEIKKIIKTFKQNNEVKTLKLMSLDVLSKEVGWLTKDVVKALKNSNIHTYQTNKAYKDYPGFFSY